jgi:hypothetical protein
MNDLLSCARPTSFGVSVFFTTACGVSRRLRRICAFRAFPCLSYGYCTEVLRTGTSTVLSGPGRILCAGMFRRGVPWGRRLSGLDDWMKLSELFASSIHRVVRPAVPMDESKLAIIHPMRDTGFVRAFFIAFLDHMTRIRFMSRVSYFILTSLEAR